MAKSLFQVWIHAVWTVKNRAPVLSKSFRFELFRHIKITAAKKGIYIDIINGVEDHVHCLFMLKPTQTIANVIKEIKGESSHWINEKNLIGGHFEWQVGYGAFSVSPKTANNVRSYIYNQEKHHLIQGFEEEIQGFEDRIDDNFKENIKDEDNLD